MSYDTIIKRTFFALAVLLAATLTTTNTLAQNRRASSLAEESTIISGYVDLQGCSDHRSAEVCATHRNGTETCDITDDEGEYLIELDPGFYKVRANHEVSLFSDYLKEVKVRPYVTLMLETVELLGGDSVIDEIINQDDLDAIEAAFGTTSSQADINGDGQVNIFDAVIAGNNYLEEAPAPEWPVSASRAKTSRLGRSPDDE